MRKLIVVLGYVMSACGSTPPPAVVPTTGSGAPCGLTPEESAAPIASNANYVPMAPVPSASASH